MINARAETLAQKPAFKDLLARRRCLVLADGFYEWRKEGKHKVPMLFRLESRKPFAFAGLWDEWEQAGRRPLRTFTIITTGPNDACRPIHNRMPAILSEEDAVRWLECNENETAQAISLLKPYISEPMEARDVSTFVNDPRNDLPECVKPVEAKTNDDGAAQGVLDLWKRRFQGHQLFLKLALLHL